MIFAGAFAYLVDPEHWATIGAWIQTSLLTTLISVVVVVVIAVPIGFVIGHTGRGRNIAVFISNGARALPTLGLLAVLILALGIGLLPVVVVLVILGIPPMLAGTYAGVESVDRQTSDAARAMGMTEWQVVSRVEWPLAAPLIVGGLRSTVLQVFSTTTVASAYAFGGLGRPLIDGIAQNNYVLVTAGAILVAGIALILEGVLALVQRLAAPRGIPLDDGRPRRARHSTPRATAQPLQEGASR